MKVSRDVQENVPLPVRNRLYVLWRGPAVHHVSSGPLLPGAEQETFFGKMSRSAICNPAPLRSPPLVHKLINMYIDVLRGQITAVCRGKHDVSMQDGVPRPTASYKQR